MKTKTLSALIFLFVITLLSYAALAVPQGPEKIQRTNDFRRTSGLDNGTGVTIFAQAGNVTSLNITSVRLTNRWQGYYGNVTGAITLDDGNNNTLYDWQLASPVGEIYASNGSIGGAVTWSNIFCFNYTNNLSEGQAIVQSFNGSDLEGSIGATIADHDSVNATFNQTYTGSFQVGGITIGAANACRQVSLYVNDAYQSTKFKEVLLTDNASIVYTALLEQDQTGFQGGPVDFEMIVGENGEVPAATPYYFFVELS